MDFHITEEDICYADIPSDNSETNIEKRKIEFTTIDETSWFKEMGYFPSNRNEMRYFIAVMDILGYMNYANIETIIKFTPKRLDALFVILKSINLKTVHLCENIILDTSIIFLNEIFMVFLKGIKIEQKSIHAFLEEYYVDLGQFFVEVLKSKMNEIVSKENIPKFTKKFCDFCFNMLNIKYYQKILDKFGVGIGEDVFMDSYDQMEEVINIFSSMVKDELPTFVSHRQLLGFLFDPCIDDDTLLKIIGEKMDIDIVVVSYSDAVDHVSLCIMDQTIPDDISKIFGLCEYDNFVFSAEHKFEMHKYAFWLRNNQKHEDEPMDEPIMPTMNKLYENGMSSYPDHAYNDVLDSFVFHCLVPSKIELINIILYMIMDGRHKPGIFNKYDTIDLETAFMLLTVSYDIELTYDEMIQSLEQKSMLPNDCPLEFILRLVSRILNVTINYFDYQLSLTEIDNTIHQDHHRTIALYQESPSCFYLLYPKNGDFIPLGLKVSNTKKHPKIVEV